MIIVKSRKVQVLVALVSLFFVILIKSSPAYAFTGHVLSGTPFGAGAAGELSNPLGVAVDNSEGPSSGDVYVADYANSRVLKFSPTGTLISEISGLFGPQYVAVDLSNGDLYVSESDHSIAKFDQSGHLITSFGTAGRVHNSTGEEEYEFGPTGLAVDSTTDDLFAANAGTGSLEEYESDGKHLARYAPNQLSGPKSIVVDAAGDVYVDEEYDSAVGEGAVTELSPSDEYTKAQPLDSRSPLSVGIDNSTGDVYVGVNGPTGYYIQQYDSLGDRVTQFGQGDVTESYGIAVNASTHAVYVSDIPSRAVAIFEPAGPNVVTSPPENIQSTSFTLSGQIEPTEGGPVTECYFEYGTDDTYGHKLKCDPEPDFNAPTSVSAELTGLIPGKAYHYRLVGSNSKGTSDGEDQKLLTPQPPQISSLYSSGLTETTAVLHAEINPNGFDTTYHFDFGPTATYGSQAPVASVDIGSGEGPQSVTIELTGLVPHTVYHFRATAENQWGTTVTEDQTFNYFPPTCPNETVRQQSDSSFLPDCRAYELVSPAEMGNVKLDPYNGPPAPYADNRFAFYGQAGAIEGTDPTNALYGDTYVATRTNDGWITKYTGIHGNEALFESTAVTDKSLSTLLDFVIETGAFRFGPEQPPNNIPYIWDSQGNSLGRWPADASAIPDANEVSGSFQPSPTFSHLAFSSTNVVFAPGGLTGEPGSAYDYDVAENSTMVISKAPDGSNLSGGPGPISFPAEHSGDPAQSAPGISEDGNRILMSVAGDLYMRVGDAITYAVSNERPVTYVGMTDNASEVYFTSAEQLTSEDHDTSVDLYMWDENTDQLTLVSKGADGTGETDGCSAAWIEKCNIEMVRGEDSTDNAVASESGDVYFYSPEQLDSGEGIQNGRNLYVYRNGQVQLVSTLEPAHALTRIQVSPTDAHAAFVTASPITSYNNAGFREMYAFTPATGALRCASCVPNGEPPKANVKPSLNGIFMSNDGRTFFSTTESLVPQDTNETVDVYEYVEGRPQLITRGIDPVSKALVNKTGLVGVSADGENVYFDTASTLVGQDKNGNFLKFYDARTDGGFSFAAPPAPCVSGDECVGAGSSPAATFPSGTTAALGSGGNRASGRSVRRHRRRSTARRHSFKRRGHSKFRPNNERQRGGDRNKITPRVAR